MKTVNEWYELEFMPWKKAMDEHSNKQNRMVQKVKQHSAELKYVVSLLLEKREAEAVKVWNEIGIEPKVLSMELSLSSDTLKLETESGELDLSLDTLLEELQLMVA